MSQDDPQAGLPGESVVRDSPASHGLRWVDESTSRVEFVSLNNGKSPLDGRFDRAISAWDGVVGNLVAPDQVELDQVELDRLGRRAVAARYLEYCAPWRCRTGGQAASWFRWS